MRFAGSIIMWWVARKLSLADFVPTWGLANKVMFYTGERALSGSIEKHNMKARKSAIQKEAEINKCYTEQSFIPEWFNKSYIRCSQHGSTHVSTVLPRKICILFTERLQNEKVECLRAAILVADISSGRASGREGGAKKDFTRYAHLSEAFTTQHITDI